MPFAKEDLPPLFDKIIKAMEENGGTMTTKEFKDLIWKMRFTKEDTLSVERWLNLNGYITIAGKRHIILLDSDKYRK